MSDSFSSITPQIRAQSPVTQSVDLQPRKKKAVQKESVINKRTAGIGLAVLATLGTAIAGCYYGSHYLNSPNIPRLDPSQTLAFTQQSYLPVQPYSAVPNIWDTESFLHVKNVTTLLNPETLTAKKHLSAQPFCPSVNSPELCLPNDRNLTSVEDSSPTTALSRNISTIEAEEMPPLSSNELFNNIASSLFSNKTLSHVSNTVNQTAQIVYAKTKQIVFAEVDLESYRAMQIGGINGTQILKGASQLSSFFGGYLTTDVISNIRKLSLSTSIYGGVGVIGLGYLAIELTENNHEFTRLAQASVAGAALGVCHRIVNVANIFHNAVNERHRNLYNG